MKNIYQLQAKDFQAWCRRQVRQFGRKSEVASIQFSAVEMWLKELGIEAGFLAGAEIEYGGQVLGSDFQASGYYLFDEQGMMELKAGRWLDIANLESADAYLIAR